MPRGRPKGQVSTGPLELVGLLRHCEWVAKEKLRLPAGISDREEARKLAYYFLQEGKAGNGPLWKTFKLRKRDSDCDPAQNEESIRKWLARARKVRQATPKAWSCLVNAWTTMCKPEDIAAAEAQGLTPIELIATNMLLYVVAGIVDEGEVETLFSNLSDFYRKPSYYAGAWSTVTRRVRERSGVTNLRELPVIPRQFG